MTRSSSDPGQRTRTRILVVEDEQDLQDLVRYNLEREGYTVASALNGEQALRQAEADPPDLILLDLMLPGIDGLNVCRKLKADEATADIPVIMLTAKGEEADIVVGLEMGADDYIAKPFSPRILTARIKAVLRRRAVEKLSAQGDEGAVRIGALVVDPERHDVTYAGNHIELTATEFRLLHLLASRPGRVFTRDQIIQAIHGNLAAVSERSVDVQVVSLRRKLGDGGEHLQTVRGVGYRYAD